MQILTSRLSFPPAGSHLVQEDPETGKGEFAFDNPAFKTDATHNNNHKVQSSPLDTKWMPKQNGQNGMDAAAKKAAASEEAASAAPASSGPPRIVGMRGSDFTGLGIEMCGGLKEGIYVRKVMPQGPAAGVVHVGDRITSITIDFNHIALEDAMAILGNASPYNVKLELADAKANVEAMPSGSQSDVNTVRGGE